MTQTQEEQEKLRKAIIDLRDKANMLSTCHSVLSDQYRSCNTILTTAILVFSVLEVGTAFISEQFVQRTVGISPDTLMWIEGLLAMSLFATGLLLSQWNFANKAADHRTAIRHCFVVLNRARYLLDSEEPLSKEKLEDLRVLYAKNTEEIPKIPERRFLAMKQHHLRKIAMSREISRTPHVSLRQIRKRLREQENQSTQDL